MALRRRSAGSCRLRDVGARHHHKAAMTPKLLRAFAQKGVAIPPPAVMIPPNAGPMARLILIPTLLAVTAGDNSLRGTSCGTTACQAGATRAEAAPIRNAK